ncbi:MAG: DUF928 domain-containing protein [Calothrix sp. MO_167.B42]|nr:DUF928 domain-containing protein [Calothrix sp. MO_167.B42]
MQIRLPIKYIWGKQWKLLAFSLVLSSFPLIADAQTLSQTSLKQVKIPKLDRPGRRESGGTRRPGEICISGKVPVLALLLPKTNVGLTTAAYPRFFWYAPNNKAQQVRFSLYKMDRQLRRRTLIYRRNFQPIPQGGISSFSLPKDGRVAPLAIKGNYLWSVSIICNLQDTSPNSVITSYGWVQRVQLNRNLANKLPKLSQSDRLSIYSREGLWFDFLATLADLRACNIRNQKLSTRWQKTLTQVGLKSISQKKLLGLRCPQRKSSSSNSQTETVKNLTDRLRFLRDIQNQN